MFTTISESEMYELITYTLVGLITFLLLPILSFEIKHRPFYYTFRYQIIPFGGIIAAVLSMDSAPYDIYQLITIGFCCFILFGVEKLTRKVVALRVENSRLQKHISCEKNNYQNLEKEKLSLENSVASMQTNTKDLLTEINKLSLNLNASEKKVTAITLQLDHKSAHFNEKSARISQLLTDVEAKNDIIQKLQSKVEEYRRRESESGQDTLYKRIDFLEKELAAREVAFQREMDDLACSLQVEKDFAQALQGQLDANEAKLQKLQETTK